MKLLAALATGWLVLSIAIGWFVSSVLESHRRSRIEAALLRSSEVMTDFIAANQWGPSPEGDQRWIRMEEQLAIEAIRLKSEESTASGVSWRREPNSSYRVAVTAELPPGSVSTRVKIQQKTGRAVEVVVWRWAWLALNTVALVFAVVVLRYQKSEIDKTRRVLDPWVASVQGESHDVYLLSEVDDNESRLGASMGIIAESVNRTYADLKASNERSELVFRNLKEGVLAVDDGARVLLANRSLRNLLGLSDEPYLHRPLLEVVRAPAISDLVESVLRDGSTRDTEVEFGSQPSYLRIFARPLPLSDERHGALLTVRDETMLKRVELIRREFVANASHELKTPLSAIRAYAETLQLGAIKDLDAATDFVSNIVAQADRMNMLVQGMLQLSRAEVGSALNFQQFDAYEALQPCLASVEAVANAKQVSVHVKRQAQSLGIKSDRDAFQTISSNLLSNAVRYTEGGGNVLVTLSKRSESLVLEVEDTGIGMEQSDLERAFERFYRAHKDRSTDTGGTGLGLSMVKHLTQALGGTVTATSEPGKGSVFTVILPTTRQVEA